jgi:hypothetical protein
MYVLTFTSEPPTLTKIERARTSICTFLTDSIQRLAEISIQIRLKILPAWSMQFSTERSRDIKPRDTAKGCTFLDVLRHKQLRFTLATAEGRVEPAGYGRTDETRPLSIALEEYC